MFSLNLASPIETNNGCSITKRSILAATSKLYDPLGILSPVIILWKIIFQSVCKSKIGWDDPVEMFIHEQWLKRTQDLKMVGVVQLNRHYFHGKSLSELQSVQINGFADASERAYEAVVYLRVELTDGTVFTELVTSRTRVAPINGDTIPRLELLGAVVLARLINSVLTAFEGTLRLVANRLWWNGPEFLLKGKDAWQNLPVNPEVISTEPDTWLQLKKESSSSQKKQRNSTVLANVVADRVTSERKLNLDCIIPLKGFSSLQRLIRVTAYVLRFVSNVKQKNEKKELTDEDLKQEEIERARDLWIRELQGSVLDDEKFDQVKVSLSLYKDDKEIRSLTAASFIKALARFKGRRETPTLIVSDNGKTFKDSRVQAYCQRDGTKWRFNVEAAPWWGGFFERLVKSVKLSLKKCLRNARLNYDELSTTLVEVEAVLNPRPLTYVYDEFKEPLTPSHLVTGRRTLSMPSKNYSIDVPHTQQALSTRAKFLQSILYHFWIRWRAEYLTQLREQHRCSKRVSSLRKVQMGDVVCIHEKTTPRQLWRLGRVQRLLPGPDGEGRSAVVKVKSGNLPSSEWRRPLQRLNPLEVKLNAEPNNAVPITVMRDEDVPAVVVNPS
ncbi:uncharacterized protein [Montipora foliosa]|uniref:uncharacterized protein n=1 Tax=Montipora foliosa TaxID=591990 RepID=UPI0035F187B1